MDSRSGRQEMIHPISDRWRKGQNGRRSILRIKSRLHCLPCSAFAGSPYLLQQTCEVAAEDFRNALVRMLARAEQFGHAAETIGPIQIGYERVHIRVFARCRDTALATIVDLVSPLFLEFGS